MMFEGISILDVVNTGALGMMFYFVLQLMGELKEIRKDNAALITMLVNKINGVDDKEIIDSEAAIRLVGVGRK